MGYTAFQSSATVNRRGLPTTPSCAPRRALGRLLAQERARNGHVKDPIKVAFARELRQLTPMTRDWIATALQMGSASYLSALLSQDENWHATSTINSKSRPL